GGVANKRGGPPALRVKSHYDCASTFILRRLGASSGTVLIPPSSGRAQNPTIVKNRTGRGSLPRVTTSLQCRSVPRHRGYWREHARIHSKRVCFFRPDLVSQTTGR